MSEPKRPLAGRGWARGPNLLVGGIAAESYGAQARLAVLTSFGLMPEPTWHVSVSARKGVVSDEDLWLVRCDFDMVEAEEDNSHGAVKARHLWKVKA